MKWPSIIERCFKGPRKWVALAGEWGMGGGIVVRGRKDEQQSGTKDRAFPGEPECT